MSEKKIAEALGLKWYDEEEVKSKKENLPEIIEEDISNVPSITSSYNEETIKDIELARKNIKDIIVKGGESLDEILALAKQSESARSFEVASTLMKTLLDANKDFVDMSMKRKYAKEETPASTQNNVTNNNLIISTADLLKMLKGNKQSE
jgi:hypothetical protein